jgi:hypothetical protein
MLLVKQMLYVIRYTSFFVMYGFYKQFFQQNCKRCLGSLLLECYVSEFFYYKYLFSKQEQPMEQSISWEGQQIKKERRAYSDCSEIILKTNTFVKNNRWWDLDFPVVLRKKIQSPMGESTLSHFKKCAS